MTTVTFKIEQPTAWQKRTQDPNDGVKRAPPSKSQTPVVPIYKSDGRPEWTWWALS